MKDTLIEKLLRAAKKHKILTYPVLALVAVISIISYFFDWSTGAGKRVVAVVMVMVMLVSQSCFLTSSATELIDDENAALVQQALQEEQIVDAPSNPVIQEDTAEAVTEAPADTAGETITEESSSSPDEEVIDNPYVEDDDLDGDEEAPDTYTDADAEDGLQDEELDSPLASKTIYYQFFYVYVNESGNRSSASVPQGTFQVTSNESTGNNYTYNIKAVKDPDTFLQDLKKDTDSATSENSCYELEGWYLDEKCTKSAAGTDYTKMSANAKDGSGNDMIALYAKRTLVKYKVTIVKGNTEDPADEVTYYTDADQVSGIQDCYYVPVSSGALQLTGIERPKYTIRGADVDTAATASVSGNDSLTIRFSGEKALRTVTLTWNGKPYQIRYAKHEITDLEQTEFTYDTVYYDGMQSFMSGSYAEEKEGYEFSGWEWEAGGTVINPDTAVVKDYQDKLYSEDEPVTLYPVYVYADFELQGVENGETLVYYYKEEAEPRTVTAVYHYRNTRVENAKFTYEIQSNTLEQYGLKAEYVDGSDGLHESGIRISTVEGGPTKRTSSGVPLTIKVTPGNGDTPKTFTIYLRVDPKVVKVVVPEAQRNKVYDGTTDAVNLVTRLETDVDTGETVWVTYTGSGAYYNDANVAGANRITIPNGSWTLHVEPSSSDGNYVLELESGSIVIPDCHIEPRRVFMATGTYKPRIRAGEQNPVERFYVGIDEGSSGSGDGFLNDGDRNESLKEVTYTTDPVRDDLEKLGIYKILASVPSTSNYKFLFTIEALGSFEVIQERAELGVNYNFNGVQQEDGDWYIGDSASIVPVEHVNELGGYDTVYISRDGGQTWVEGGVLKEEDSNNPNLRIKLKDSKTGAVTTDEPLTVHYDMTKPVYLGYTISEGIEYNSNTGVSQGGLFFPGHGSVLDFGTYVNSTIAIHIRYKEDTSGLDKLHYGLFGADADTNEVAFDSTGTATIRILKDSISGAGQKGVITCYATDTAGNKSEKIKLKPDGNKTDDYEWCIEQAAPVVEPLVVKAGDEQTDIVKDQSNVPEDQRLYYHNCLAEVHVTDSVSGIYNVIWHVNGEDIPARVSSTTSKVTQEAFTRAISPSSSESYTVYATVTDNAGNTIDTNKVTFRVDDIPPNLDVDFDSRTWTNKTTISFTTSDDLSGVDYVKVTDANGNTIDCDLGKPDENGVYSASFEATVKGKYTITVADKAGNKATWEWEITNISTETPDCPEITVVPEYPDGKNGWYITEPQVSISNVTMTSDETPVTTSYRHWLTGDASYNETEIKGTSEVFKITDSGEHNIKAWSISASGEKCYDFDDHVTTILYDGTEPDITITPDKGSNSSILVRFTITDDMSGVDGNSIKVYHGTREIAAEIDLSEDGYTYIGSFEVDETGNYIIEAADNAGNVSNKAAFTPMSMKIKAVTNISTSSATLGAVIYKGTYDIKSATIAYRKITDNGYTEAQSLSGQDAKGNVTISTVLSDLREATAYAYKITAVSVQNEVLEYEGYFRTLSSLESGISIIGTARYADNHDGVITVGLYDKNVCIMAIDCPAGNEFVFRNIPDGFYSLVATDGFYSKTVRVIVQGGLVLYPDAYIDMVLSGMNTSVDIKTEETPNITADNMDSIFEYDFYNYTDEDMAIIAAGGTIEFKLEAALMKVTSVSANEIAAMYAVTDKNKIVGAYLDLSLYKIVTDVNGNVQKTRVTELGNGAYVSITIPLGDLAGKPGLEVVRIHQNGDHFTGASLSDMDSNPSTYTISTTQFSTYAVLYSLNAGDTGNGDIQHGSTDPGSGGKPHTTTEDSGRDPGRDDPTTEAPHQIPENTNTNQSPGESNTTVGSLRSPGTAKTGDAAPVAAMAVVMITALGGIVVLRKKAKN